MINSHRKELRTQRVMVPIPLKEIIEKIVGGILRVEAASAGVNYAEESVRAKFTRLTVLGGTMQVLKRSMV